MATCVIRGPNGVMSWGYHAAAALGPWTFTASDTGGDLTAVVVSADTFKLSQPALTFCVTRQNGVRWKWPVLSLRIADGTLYASLGPQESGMPSRVVAPESKVLPISNGDWLLVKKRLNHGEYQELLARKYLADSTGAVRVNLHKAGWESIAVYLIDWSLVGLDNKQIPIEGKSCEDIDQVLCTFDDETVTEIKKAIEAHVAAMDAERAASKKTPDGATGSSAISPSLVGAAGDTNGSAS